MPRKSRKLSEKAEKFIQEYDELLSKIKNNDDITDLKELEENIENISKLQRIKERLFKSFLPDNLTVDESAEIALGRGTSNDVLNEDLYNEYRGSIHDKELKQKFQSLYDEKDPFDVNLKRYKNYINENKKQINKVLSKDDKTIDDITDGFNKKISFRASKTFKINTKDELRTTLENLESENRDIDSLLFDIKNEKTIAEVEKEYEESPVKKEINALLSKTTDIETRKLLEEALEITKNGNPKSVHDDSQMAETLGTLAEKLNTKRNIEYMEEQGVNFDDLEFSRIGYEVKSDIDLRSKYAKEYSKKVDLGENKEDILNLLEKIDKIDPEGSLEVLRKLSKDIQKAAINKDVKLISNLVKEYKAKKSEIDEIYNKIDELSKNNFFPTNLSFAREPNCPFEYRTDVKKSSIYRGISTFNKGLRFNGLTIKEFVEDPIGTLKKYYQNNLNNGELSSYKKSFKNGNELLKSIIKQDDAFKNFSKKIINVENKNNMDLIAGASIIRELLTKDKSNEYNVGFVMFQTSALQDLSVEPSILFNESNQINDIIHLIATPYDDFDIHNLSSMNKLNPLTFDPKEQFDFKKYIETKTTPEKMIEKMVDFYKGGIDYLENPIKNAFKEMATQITETGIYFDESHLKALDCFINGNLKDLNNLKFVKENIKDFDEINNFTKEFARLNELEHKNKNSDEYLESQEAKNKLSTAKKYLKSLLNVNLNNFTKTINYIKENKISDSVINNTYVDSISKLIKNNDKKKLFLDECSKLKEIDAKLKYIDNFVKKSKIKSSDIEEIKNNSLPLIKTKMLASLKLNSSYEFNHFIRDLIKRGVKQNEILIDFNKATSILKDVRNKEESPVKNEIDTLISQLKENEKENEQNINLLNEVKEVTKSIKASDNAIMNGIVEELGKLINSENLKIELDYLKNNNLIEDNEINVGRDTYDFRNIPIDQVSKVVKRFYAPIVYNDKNRVNEVKTIIKKIDEIDKDGDFQVLIDLKQKLVNDVKDNKLDTLQNDLNEYKKIDDELTDVINKMDKITKEKNYPYNFSFVRVSPVPFKYRNDFKNGSNYRCISQFNKGLKKYGISLDEFFLNPTKAILKAYQKSYTDNAVQKYVKENNTYNILKTFLGKSNDDLMKIKNELNNNSSDILGFYQGAREIGNLLSDKDRLKYMSALHMIENSLVPVSNSEPSLYFMNEPEKNIAKIICFDKEDLDLYNIYETPTIDYDTLEPKKFMSINEYIKTKSSPKKVINKILDFLHYEIDFKKDLIDRSIKYLADEMLKDNKLNLTTDELIILNNLKNGIEVNRDLLNNKTIKADNYIDDLTKYSDYIKKNTDTKDPFIYKNIKDYEYKIENASKEIFLNYFKDKKFNEIAEIGSKYGISSNQINIFRNSFINNPLFKGTKELKDIEKINESTEFTDKQKTNLIYKYLENKNKVLYNEYHKTITERLINDICNDGVITDKDSFLKACENLSLNGSDLDKIVVDIDKMPTIIEGEDLSYKSNVENEINELININKNNQDIVELLKESNEILKKPSNVQNIVSVAENLSRLGDEKTSNLIHDCLIENGFKESDIKYDKTTIHFKKNDAVTRSLHAKDSFNYEINLSDESKNKIKTVVNSVLNLNEIDSLKKIIENKKNLESAIKEKNIKKAIKIKDEYTDRLRRIDETLKVINDNSYDRFPINQNYIRSENMPKHLRYDLKGTSILRVLEKLSKYIDNPKYGNLSLDMLINDPLKSLQTFYKSIINSETYQKYNNENSNDLLRTLTNSNGKLNDLNIDISKTQFELIEFRGALSVFSNLLPINEAKEFEGTLFRYYDPLENSMTLNASKILKKDKESKIAELIVKEKEDFNIYNLDDNYVDPETFERSKKFNIINYMNSKSSIERVTFKMVDFIDRGIEFDSDLNKILKNMATTIVNSKNYKTNESCDKLLNYIKNGKINEIPPYLKVAVKSTSEFKKDVSNNFNGLTIKDVTSKLYNLEKEYNKIGFFKKIFNSDAKALKHQIDYMKNTLYPIFNKDLIDAARGELKREEADKKKIVNEPELKIKKEEIKGVNKKENKVPEVKKANIKELINVEIKEDVEIIKEESLEEIIKNNGLNEYVIELLNEEGNKKKDLNSYELNLDKSFSMPYIINGEGKIISEIVEEEDIHL